ncbi:gamma-glutamyltransferase family protein [Ramlibacter sp.]|uniref:gamma-glutamyltransferase family protein n=1 Tax=Ramlibacter sp. TaxID=1917967 RepID=UPI003D0DE3CA
MRPVSEIRGRKGMVVSGHEDSSRVGWDILAAGGSVADAAIAGAMVMGVTLPQACTLGGDAFILVHEASSGRTHGINASGPSPALTSLSLFPSGMHERGAMSCGVPGMLGGLAAMHERFGTLAWRELLAPAIALARDGFEASAGLARATEVFAAMLAKDPGCRALFAPEGRPLRTGERFRQSRLADTLEAVARGGANAFYDGEIAASLARACEEAGGLLRADDFRGYVPEWVEPLAVPYRGHEVRVMPPNSFGLYLLLQLMALDDMPDDEAPLLSAARFSRLVRAAEAAFAVGSRAIADPAFDPEPTGPLLGAEGRQRLKDALPGRAPNLGGTAVISVVDAQGNAATIVQSVFLVFGSGIADPRSGLLLNNRLFGFSVDPSHPNCVAPRKRPAHTLCPAMVLRDGRLRFALGTPGGPGQTITLSQVIEGMLHRKASLVDAIRAPRWSMDLQSACVVEPSMPEHVISGVRAQGIEMKHTGPDSPFFGSAEGIELHDDGTLTGVADNRRDAAAQGA